MLALLAIAAAGIVVGATPADDQQQAVLRAAVDEATPPWPVIDDLVDGDVLRVRVTDGEPGGAGTVAQCGTTCWNRYAVTFDDAGVARFQYQLERRECDPQSSCRLQVDVGRRVAVAFTVFGGPAPPAPDVSLAPAGPVAPGDVVTVRIDGLSPGAGARGSFCADECIGNYVGAADRSGQVTLEIPIGARCDDCGIAVVAGSSRTVLPVRFVPLPSPRYDPVRLVAGLAAALALVLLARRLVVTTDWRPPSEAAVPEFEE